MIPARCALALQADGWWLRSDIIWSKPNPMPESVTDRPTKAHEYIFLLSKSANYYYDADAVREPYNETSLSRYSYQFNPDVPSSKITKNPAVGSGKIEPNPAGRNRRTVWEIATEPTPFAHFATYPQKLIEPCILAGTSANACPHCGAPWERVVERQSASTDNPRAWQGVPEFQSNRGNHRQEPKKKGAVGTPSIIEIGWSPTCTCEGNDGSGRCVVLDPFAGSATTLLVAAKLGRRGLGIELNESYVDIMRQRLSGAKAQRQLLI